MLQSMTDSLAFIREIVFEQVAPGTRFAFSFTDDADVGDLQAGPLFDQNEEFFLFEAEIADIKRAGASAVSPTRCRGELVVSLLTKDSMREIPNKRRLEEVSNWFAEQTIRGIRFRTFTPLSTTKVMGFTSYSGVLNFDFDISRG